MGAQVVRRWHVEPKTRGRSVYRVPVMHPSARVVKVFGNERGIALVLDQKAGHMAALDDSVHELELVLVESDSRDMEVEVPKGTTLVGAFFSERWGVPFMAFVRDRSPTGVRRASSGKGS